MAPSSSIAANIGNTTHLLPERITRFFSKDPRNTWLEALQYIVSEPATCTNSAAIEENLTTLLKDYPGTSLSDADLEPEKQAILFNLLCADTGIKIVVQHIHSKVPQNWMHLLVQQSFNQHTHRPQFVTSTLDLHTLEVLQNKLLANKEAAKLINQYIMQPLSQEIGKRRNTQAETVEQKNIADLFFKAAKDARQWPASTNSTDSAERNAQEEDLRHTSKEAAAAIVKWLRINSKALPLYLFDYLPNISLIHIDNLIKKRSSVLDKQPPNAADYYRSEYKFHFDKLSTHLCQRRFLKEILEPQAIEALTHFKKKCEQLAQTSSSNNAEEEKNRKQYAHSLHQLERTLYSFWGACAAAYFSEEYPKSGRPSFVTLTQQEEDFKRLALWRLQEDSLYGRLHDLFDTPHLSCPPSSWPKSALKHFIDSEIQHVYASLNLDADTITRIQATPVEKSLDTFYLFDERYHAPALKAHIQATEHIGTTPSSWYTQAAAKSVQALLHAIQQFLKVLCFPFNACAALIRAAITCMHSFYLGSIRNLSSDPFIAQTSSSVKNIADTPHALLQTHEYYTTQLCENILNNKELDAIQSLKEIISAKKRVTHYIQNHQDALSDPDILRASNDLYIISESVKRIEKEHSIKFKNLPTQSLIKIANTLNEVAASIENNHPQNSISLLFLSNCILKILTLYKSNHTLTIHTKNTEKYDPLFEKYKKSIREKLFIELPSTKGDNYRILKDTLPDYLIRIAQFLFNIFIINEHSNREEEAIIKIINKFKQQESLSQEEFEIKKKTTKRWVEISKISSSPLKTDSNVRLSENFIKDIERSHIYSISIDGKKFIFKNENSKPHRHISYLSAEHLSTNILQEFCIDQNEFLLISDLFSQRSSGFDGYLANSGIFVPPQKIGGLRSMAQFNDASSSIRFDSWSLERLSTGAIKLVIILRRERADVVFFPEVDSSYVHCTPGNFYEWQIALEINMRSDFSERVKVLPEESFYHYNLELPLCRSGLPLLANRATFSNY